MHRDAVRNANEWDDLHTHTHAELYFNSFSQNVRSHTFNPPEAEEFRAFAYSPEVGYLNKEAVISDEKNEI